MITARLYKDFVDRRLGRKCHKEEKINSPWELRRKIREYRATGIFPTFVDMQGSVLDEDAAFSYLQAELESKIVKIAIAVLVVVLIASVSIFLR